MLAEKGTRFIGLISDTHGTLDARVADAFTGVERILHAGDVGTRDVLWDLEAIAPVVAAAGNVDHWDVSGELPGLARLTIAGVKVSIVHVRSEIPHGAVAESDVVVFGHSHMPLVRRQDGVLWVNPGSATQPRRSEIGRSVALLKIVESGDVTARVVPLSEFGESRR